MYKLAPYISIVSLLISAYCGYSIIVASEPLPDIIVNISVTEEPSIDFVKSVIDCAHNEYLSDITCQLIHSDGE